MSNRHTIILLQTSPHRATRTFMDYESISQAMDGICGLYERKLRDINPAIRNITYDISDLYNFIDGLADLSALVYSLSPRPFPCMHTHEHTFKLRLPCDDCYLLTCTHSSTFACEHLAIITCRPNQSTRGCVYWALISLYLHQRLTCRSIAANNTSSRFFFTTCLLGFFFYFYFYLCIFINNQHTTQFL